MRSRYTAFLAALGLIVLLGASLPGSGLTASFSPGISASRATSSTKESAKPPASAQPTAAEIAAARAAKKVWVNLRTGIYHKGGRWYGKTKEGKFMTEDEAKKAGYKRAKRD